MSSEQQLAAARRVFAVKQHFSGGAQLHINPTVGQETQLNWAYKMLGWVTIPEGETIALKNSSGELSLLEGPRSCFLINESYAILPRYVADSTEYVAIQYRDGTQENIKGPCVSVFNPKTHQSLNVQKSIVVEDGYAIVVYHTEIHPETKKEEIKRRIIYGPAVYTYKNNEYLHRFFWMIPDQRNPTAAMRKLKSFKKLRVVPDQIYFDVDNVRTSDDALITVKLMIFFKLMDIQKMLKTTHDPVQEMINTITADIVEFAGSRMFATFKDEAEKLNSLESYPQLRDAIDNVGFKITKVVYRGYIASAKLQMMHNDAIEARTKLQLKSETESQEQDLDDMRQERRLERLEKERKSKEEEALHAREMEKAKFTEALRQRRAEAEETQRNLDAQRRQELTYLEKRRQLENQKRHDKKESDAAYLRELRAMDVDVTRYLVSQHQHPDKIFKVEGKSSPPLHIHAQ
eukprot:TRINITY_DN14338_c0_g1_i1.p1 TRINITY_DN14338_c0_g1~~TRINITY_DN14338_c0_g1_i1.p1  ORF type:complete len:471 (-),score=87.93 TRINITY_DN14338_c0_g1_i1:4-1386(-)